MRSAATYRAATFVAAPMLVVLGTGCATMRSDFTPASGEKLGYHDVHGTYQATEDVEVGAVYNNAGEKVLSETRQEEVTHAYHDLWPTQGGQRIDEESFFRIAKDEEAIRRYDEWHESGVDRNRNGAIVLGIGLGVAAAGGGLLGYGLATKTDMDPKTPFTTAGYVGLAAGGITALIGGIMMASGKTQAAAANGTLYNDPGRYRADAKRYNTSMRHSTTTTDGQPPIAGSRDEEPPPPPPPPRHRR